MPSSQLYLYDKNNHLNKAATTISGYNVSNSTKQAIIVPGDNNQGNGTISLYGDYSGDADKEMRVRIFDDDSNDPNNIGFSNPTFDGAGTGEIDIMHVSNLPSQEVQIICINLGKDTKTAFINIGGLKFEADVEGILGNQIYMEIGKVEGFIEHNDPTGTQYLTQEKISEGTEDLQGEIWNFGINSEFIAGDELPLPSEEEGGSLHRIFFEADPYNVYLQWKALDENNEIRYYFSEPIKGYIPKGNPVFKATGGRTIRIWTDHQSDEVRTLTNIKTILDLHQALLEDPIEIPRYLIPAQENVDVDRLPGGIAIRELNFTTVAHYTAPKLEPENEDWVGLQNLSIVDSLSIQSTINFALEYKLRQWYIYATGELLQVIPSGGTFENEYIKFDVPNMQNVSDEFQNQMDYTWSWVYQPTDTTNETLAQFCVYARAGINLPDGTTTVRLTYTRIDLPCDCPPDFDFDEECLGLEEEGGGPVGYICPDLPYWTNRQFENITEQITRTLSLPSGTEASEEAWREEFRTTKAQFIKMARAIFNLKETDPHGITAIAGLYQEIIDGIWIENTTNGINYQWNGIKFTPALPTGLGGYSINLRYDTDKWATLVEWYMQYHMTYHQKKNSFGSECYEIDESATSYWTVEVNGTPYCTFLYTDIPYYSHNCYPNGEIFNTQEFAILVWDYCSQAYFNDGDVIIVTFDNQGTSNNYGDGDTITFSLFPYSVLYCEGGIDGDDTLTFQVKGEVTTFPNYTMYKPNPEVYDTDSLKFLIEEGGIPFALKDTFSFNVESGIWRYLDNAIWSVEKYINSTVQDFAYNLDILFKFGNSPSFEIGDYWDVYLFQSNQVNYLFNLDSSLSFNGSGSIDIDFGSAEQIDAFIIDQHSITGNVTFAFSNIALGGVDVGTDTVTLTAGETFCKLYDYSARYVRITFSDTQTIGYMFIGEKMQLQLGADRILPKMAFSMSSSKPDTEFDLYNFLKEGFQIEHSSFLRSNDWNLINEMLKYLKQRNNMPLYFIPNLNASPLVCTRGKVKDNTINVGQRRSESTLSQYRTYTITFELESIE